jgi:hypothetical protein
MNRETARQIITEHLGMRKMSAKMVPRILTDDQKQRRFHISSDLLHNAEMSDRVITVTKRGVFTMTRKQNQSKQWITEFT